MPSDMRRLKQFEELGPEFSLLAFDADDEAVSAFERAARALNVPLKVIRDDFQGEREASEARLILMRPDRYVVWTGDTIDDAHAVVARAVGRS